jgi:hypothetical protein
MWLKRHISPYKTALAARKLQPQAPNRINTIGLALRVDAP